MTRPTDPQNPSVPSQARILRELGEELRAEATPSLDWGRVERGLFERLDLPGNGERLETGETPAAREAARISRKSSTASSGTQPSVSQPSVSQPSVSESRVSQKADDRAGSSKAAASPVRLRVWHVGVWNVARWQHVAIAASVALFVTFGTLWRMDLSAPRVTAGQDGDIGADRAAGPRGDSLDRVRGGDLARLRAGDVVEATDGSVVYEAPGIVRWTLAAGGRLSVTQGVDASSHVLALERGSIRAEVNPAASRIHRLASDVVERFAIEVDGTRVAVRGTVFTVTRTTAGMVVNVERGTVAVGRIGTSGLTEGRLLVAPARQSFGLDGPLSTGPLGANRTLLDRRSELAAPNRSERGSDVSGSERFGDDRGLDLRAGSTPATVRSPGVSGKSAPRDVAGASAGGEPRLLTAASIRSGLSQCFDRTYRAGSSKVGFSVSSTFHVTVDERGAVTAARFVPPVRAELARCAGAVIAGKFASGPAQLAVPIQYDVGSSSLR